MATPMHEFQTGAGTTAFVPGSLNHLWDIKKCYRGEFDDVFMQNHVQPTVSFSDLLVWDSRTLHSQMPNHSEHARYMLLFNYVEQDILEDLMDYENSLI
jgi:ectoine hydroxylase-related dioxygenase (phytanoyl-CoA dioxygenase family)